MTIVTDKEKLWIKLRDKRYRDELSTAHAKRIIPLQVRSILKARGWTQGDLASRMGRDASAMTRALNPTYGNLTLNTILGIARGLDVAFVGQFVPFSELAYRFLSLSEEELGKVKSFDEEEGVV